MGTFLISAVAAFNLVCTVAAQTQGGIRVDPPAPKEFSLVVDLDSRRFCYDSCYETHPISKVNTQEIFFVTRTFDPDSELLSVNRESGRLTWETGSGEYLRKWFGRCQRSDFTGFPEKKF